MTQTGSDKSNVDQGLVGGEETAAQRQRRRRVRQRRKRRWRQRRLIVRGAATPQKALVGGDRSNQWVHDSYYE